MYKGYEGAVEKWYRRLQKNYCCNMSSAFPSCNCETIAQHPYNFLECKYLVHKIWRKVFDAR